MFCELGCKGVTSKGKSQQGALGEDTALPSPHSWVLCPRDSLAFFTPFPLNLQWLRKPEIRVEHSH